MPTENKSAEPFQREDRYIVIKHSDIRGFWREDVREQFFAALERLNEHNVRIPQRQFLVIESDWPEYEPVWQMIERRITGQPPVTAAEALDAVLHWRNKHAQAARERDALQQRQNVADQRIDDLTELLSKSLMAIKRSLQAGRDRIVDLGGDCDGVEYMMNSDLTVQEIRTALSPVTQPASADKFSTCLGCFGSGTVSTGISEASSTVCNACNGTGKEHAESANSR